MVARRKDAIVVRAVAPQTGAPRAADADDASTGGRLATQSVSAADLDGAKDRLGGVRAEFESWHRRRYSSARSESDRPPLPRRAWPAARPTPAWRRAAYDTGEQSTARSRHCPRLHSDCSLAPLLGPPCEMPAAAGLASIQSFPAEMHKELGGLVTMVRRIRVPGMNPQDQLHGDPSETGPDRMGRADLKLGPRVRRLRRMWRTIPSAPRCKMCTSPFGAAGRSGPAAHRQGPMAGESQVLRRLLQGSVPQPSRRGDRVHPALRRYPRLDRPRRDHARRRLSHAARSVLRDGLGGADRARGDRRQVRRRRGDRHLHPGPHGRQPCGAGDRRQPRPAARDRAWDRCALGADRYRREYRRGLRRGRRDRRSRRVHRPRRQREHHRSPGLGRRARERSL